MFEHAPRVWEVGALCLAVGDLLQARFNPVSVRGEISGFSRAASGHCYFSIKDAGGQIRCAMFRRAASQLGFTPRDGDMVELRGQLGVYEQRGDLQLVVESLQRAGQGVWFEQFLRLKAQLESEGLFDSARKRPLPALPRGIGGSLRWARRRCTTWWRRCAGACRTLRWCWCRPWCRAPLRRRRWSMRYQNCIC